MDLKIQLAEKELEILKRKRNITIKIKYWFKYFT